MRNFLYKFKPVICIAICVAFFIAFICLIPRKTQSEADDSGSLLTVWQVDSFEGGKGSRADFLQKIGSDYTKSTGYYVNVISLSADAVRLNLANGITPDVISYGAGTYGIESYISQYISWCYGGYCLLALDGTADFSDVNATNTIINEGKDNFVSATALFLTLQGANFEKSTGAYVKLINGEYKYLLGTQRDIYRLKTRGAAFKIKPITEFNDLYQNISVIAGGSREECATQFIEYLLTRTGEVDKLGMLSDGVMYEDEMKEMTGLDYEYKLTSPISRDLYDKLKNIINEGDTNLLKTLLK